jgi:hypothetical protein
VPRCNPKELQPPNTIDANRELWEFFGRPAVCGTALVDHAQALGFSTGAARQAAGQRGSRQSPVGKLETAAPAARQNAEDDDDGDKRDEQER